MDLMREGNGVRSVRDQGSMTGRVMCGEAQSEHIVSGLSATAVIGRTCREVRVVPRGGIAVHIGARVAALAGANEVMVTSTVKDLVAGSGLRVEARGHPTLKGVPGEWNVFVAV